MLKKRFRTKALISVSILFTVLGTTTACGGGDDPAAVATGEALVIDGEEIASAELLDAARAEGTITVYSAISEEPEMALLKAFTEATGIEHELVRVPTNRMMERVQTEFGANRIAADVLRMPDISFIQTLVEDGVFRPFKVTSWDKIDDVYKNPEGLYYAWTLGPTAFGVNTAVVPEGDRPASYQDLLKPGLVGKIGFTGMDVGTTPWVVAMYQREKYGVDYWRGLAAQKPVLAPGNAQVADQLGRGEIGVGIIRPNVILAQKDQGAPVEMVWPSDGVPVFPFYLGVVKTSPHPKAAEVFMNWSMSKSGQAAAGTQTGEYAVRTDVDPPEMLGTTFPPLAELNAYNADEKTWVDQRTAWTNEWNTIFGTG
jgi:iron(III) transport system substrate-binding protein